MMQVLNTLEEPFALVLDGFHHIVSHEIQEAIERLLIHIPPSLRLIVISRTEPDMNIARLHVAHQVEQFTADDLRFSVDDTRTFFQATMQVEAAPAFVESLVQQAEGWPAALRIAALSLLRQSGMETFPHEFDGSDPYIVRYINEEVFDLLPSNFREFLLRTAPLEILDGNLCGAITENSDAHAILDQLAHKHLLARPVDRHQQVYRYPRLLREYLQHRIQRDHPEWLTDIHRRVATYYTKHGLIDQAVEHAFAAGDTNEILSLVETVARSKLIDGAIETLLNWIERLPTEHLHLNPRVTVYYAWSLLMRGQFHQAEDHLVIAEISLKTDYPSQLLGEIAIIHAEIAHLRGDIENAALYAQQALQYLPSEDRLIRGLALMNLGYAQWLSGEMTDADLTFQQGLVSTSDIEGEVVRLIAHSNTANLLVTQGKLRAAAETYQMILTAALDRGPALVMVAGIAYTGMGTQLYAWNQLDKAAEQVRRGLQLANPWLYISSQLPGYFLLAQIEQARKRYEASQQALNDAETYIRTGNLIPMQRLLEAQRARLRLLRSDVEGAMRWARRAGLSPDDPIEFASMGLYLTYAEVLIARGQAQDVLALLDRVELASEELTLGWLYLETVIVKATAYWQAQQHDQALEILQQALTLAEPEGHIRTFVDRGTIMETMLRRLDAACDPLSYVAELLRAFEDESQHTAFIALDLSQRATDREHALSQRELDVLNLIAQGKTNHAIAEALIISEGTVKTHIKHIFRKLSVQNRTQAVARARQLSLVD
ncbi:MAG: LuxR C-terminal-related transcriptional regulator [Anaerolineae bacterium]|nr:LuxR C-terminal-related transcriptional regulator [Anaerolineae bacterium]